MTAADATDPVEPDEVAIMLPRSEDEQRDTSNDRVPVDLDGVIIYGTRPKAAVLMKLVQQMDSDDFGTMTVAFDSFLEKILDPESAEHVRERLEDDDDVLDLDSPAVEMLFQSLVGLWYGRPTGKRPGSSGPQRRTGRRSTVRSRSRG